ncbi:DUF1127 domain-containing protein [Profundibacter amoris]|uniref:DUF1127 domain-containing protein n=1 Tax=Profundibacter amoris TaxID=2171755 RepID=A0A347UEL2_9RHOB|nr:DUF1127 domain-containing protein [Profundibacter amoris]
MTMTTCNTPARTTRKPRPTAFHMIKLALKARHQRRALRRLDSAALADLGLTRKQAKQEANRPIWDVPANWLR